MSTESVTELLEDAQFYQEEWTGTVMEGLLAADIAREDYDMLRQHINEARQMSFERDYNPGDNLTNTGFNLDKNSVY
jgi:hypothetical protein